MRFISACCLAIALAACGNPGPAALATQAPPLARSRSAAAAPWPNFKQNVGHTGVSPFSTARDTGRIVWTFQAQSGLDSSAAVGADGTVYVGGFDDRIYALDGTTGHMKWSFETGLLDENAPSISPDGTTVYESCDDGYLYALATATGKLRWKFALGTPSFSSTTVGSDGTIYVGARSGAFFAVAPDGTERWSFRAGGDVNGAPAIGPNGAIFLTAEDGKVYALDPTGKLKWTYQTGKKIDATPAVAPDGTIYTGSDDGSLYALSPSGQKKWSFDTITPLESTPAIAPDGTIYFASSLGYFYAFSPQGTQLWQWPKFGKPPAHSFSYPAGSPVVSADGTIYVTDFYTGSLRKQNRLLAFYPGKHHPKFVFAIDQAIGDTPAIGADGTIYLASYDRQVYAIH